MADNTREQLLIQVLKDAADAHHEYEDGVLKGVMDKQALGWYAGFVVGRLGNFATTTDLTQWFNDTHVRGKFEIAAKNVLDHIGGAEFKPSQKLSSDKAAALPQLVEVLKQAADTHHEYEDGALKGVMDEQALGWYAGFVVGRLGNFATTTDLTKWFNETHVRGKFELAANNVLNHLESANGGPAPASPAAPKAAF